MGEQQGVAVLWNRARAKALLHSGSLNGPRSSASLMSCHYVKEVEVRDFASDGICNDGGVMPWRGTTTPGRGWCLRFHLFFL